MKFSAVAKAILALASSNISVDATVNNQRNLQTICSCSPQAFSFTLLLAQDCSVNTLEDNPGISDTNCAIVNATSSATLSFSGDDQAVNVAEVYVTIGDIISCIPWLDPWLENCNENDEDNEPIRKNRGLQTGSPIPSVITSIQYIELDSDGIVIQIDDSQSDIEAVSGDTFSYASRSSELDPAEDISSQLDILPKTAVLFLVGFNDDGDEIRGRFVWEYTNGCGDDELTIRGDEDYGWISFDQVDRAMPEFCPALKEDTPAPTPAPFIIDFFPTPPPMIDTDLPTRSPAVDTPAPFIVDFFPTPPPMIDTDLPTPSPTVIETLAPTAKPTPEPTDEPSANPVTLDPTPFPVIIDPTPSPNTPEPTFIFSTPDPTIVETPPTPNPVTPEPSPAPTPAPVIVDLPTPSPATPAPTFIFSTPQPSIVPATPDPTPILTPFPVTPFPATELPTPSPIQLFAPTFSPSRIIIDTPEPTMPPPTPNPMIPTEAPRPVPTYEPTYIETEEPTYFETQAPSTPSPTDFYGPTDYGSKDYGHYGYYVADWSDGYHDEDYNTWTNGYYVQGNKASPAGHSKSDKKGTKTGKAASRGSKSGKGSKSKSLKGKSGKSTSEKSGKSDHGHRRYKVKDGYERLLHDGMLRT